MRKNIFYLALFFVLLIPVSNQFIYAQANDETNEESLIEEDQNNTFNVSPVDYTEINALIDSVISQRFNEALQFIKKYLLMAWAFFLSWPFLIRIIIYISLFPAAIGIIASHVLGIYRNRKEWKKHPNHFIMYSYFIKSGNFQRKKSYKNAHNLLRNHKWFIISFAGLSFRLGNYSNKSTIFMFILSFAYIPLAIFGFSEMVLRIIFGTIWLLFFSLIHRFLLFITKLISYLLIPVSKIIDRIIRKTQYCQNCYKEIELPEFKCPACGTVHKELIPGACGVLFVRCGCNKKYLPCTVITGRSRLVAKCFACESELITANARHFSIALIGGNNAGKKAFIAAFSYLYINYFKKKKKLKVIGMPKNSFNELFNMYNSGKKGKKLESHTYSLVHEYGKNKKDNLVFYDTPSEYIISDSYTRSPKYFGYCDGIILVIDPLSIKSVRNEIAVNGDTNEIKYHSADDIDKLTVQFIHQYTRTKGFSTGKVSDVPVAILINKSDIGIVNSEIGWDTINKLFRQNSYAYGNDVEVAKDKICRSYLEKIGLVNVMNNIEGAFSNISFFPVSAIGHIAEEGTAFTPVGVINPVAWITKKSHSSMARYFIGN